MGELGLVKLNPVAVTDACEMVMFDLLLLLTEIDSVLLLPTWTLPKLRPEEVRASCPDAALEYKRILRRTSFHQVFLHSKPRRLMASIRLLRAHGARWGIMERLPLCSGSTRTPAVRQREVQRCHFLPAHRSVDRSRKSRRYCSLVLGF